MRLGRPNPVKMPGFSAGFRLVDVKTQSQRPLPKAPFLQSAPLRSNPIVACILCVFLALMACPAAFGAFGLSSTTDFYTVDTGAGLVFKVRRTDNGVSTQSAGDIASLVYNGVEYQNASRGSQITSGFDYLYTGVSAVSVSATTVGSEFIKVTVVAGDLTHYYMARNGFPHIYMATYFTTEPDIHNLVRYIVRIPQNLLPNGPEPSDIRDTDFTVESGDVFGYSASHPTVALRGQTRSKHYSNMRLRDWSYIGASGTNVGVWMFRGNHEGDSGGPFYRSLLMQTGGDQEITYIINYGEVQTEPYRTGILNGPYSLVFNDGSAPIAPDTSWASGMGLTGFIGTAGRGAVSAPGITGRDMDSEYTVGFSNTTAQYWADASPADGSFTCSDMIPGTYTMKVYRNEYAVYSSNVSVSAGATTALAGIAINADPNTTVPLWRIGAWDGTPNEFINGDKVTIMHPTDVRMDSWTPGTYVVGSSSPGTGFPAYQWKDVNGNQVIQFELTAGQAASSATLRAGLTVAYSGGRPNIAVNSWTAALQGPSTQPGTRSLTVGSYRGNNTTYTFNIPASALVAGTNMLTIYPISGSGGTGFLSPGYSNDAVDFYLGGATTVPVPGAVASLAATGGSSAIDLSWTAASDATSYRIRRSGTPGGPYTEIASGVSGTTWSDSTAVDGTTYYYVVNGTNTSGSGFDSPEAFSTTTPPPARAHLRFDESAGTLAGDSSGNGWDGTFAGGTGWLTGANAKINNAVSLDGNNGVVNFAPGVVSGLADCTIACWVKWNGSTDWQRVFDFGSGGTAYMFLTPKAFLAGTRFAISTTGPAGEQVLNGPALPVGVWTHVAVTLSGNTGKLYINGSAVDTNSSLTLNPADLGNTTANHLGDSQFASDPAFNGALDEFQIHPRALGAAEIVDLASPPDPPSSPGATAGYQQVDLTWGSSPGADGYRIHRSTTSGGPYVLIAAEVTGTSYSDSPLSNGVAYHYVVTATKGPAESSHSAETSATPTSAGTTVAFWDFEDGVDGQSFTPSGSPNGSGGSVDTQAGILMRGWNTANGPTWTSAVAPNGGSLGMNNANNAQDGYVTEGALHGWSPTAWTIECTVNLREITGWETLIGRDGSSQAEPESDFYLSNNGIDDKFRINIDTVGGQRWILDGNYPVQINTWYALAVRSDGSTLSLWLDDGAGYQQIGALDITAQSVADNALPGSNLTWTFGRGWYNGGQVDKIDGSMDNIRFSNAALAAGDLIPLSPQPPAPGALSATAVSSGRIDLSWNAINGATGYNVKRAENSGGPYTVIGSDVSGIIYQDDTLAGGTTYYYVVSATIGAVTGPDAEEAMATTWTPAESWRSTHFGTIANTGDASDNADPDNDLVNNLLERAFAGDPNVSEPNLLPAVDNTAANLSIIYRKANAATDLTFTVQENAGLTLPWVPSSGSSEVISDNGTFQQIRFTRPAGSDNTMFLRIGVK